MFDFTGRTAVVTGGGRGIGAAICRTLAAGGAHVVVLSRDGGPAKEVADEIGGVAVECDVSDLPKVAEVLRDVDAQILVNNAGYDRFTWFTDTTPEYWQELLSVNLVGTMACAHALLPAMQRGRYGRIVNVTSESGRVGSRGNAVYSAAKSGVHGFTKSIAMENARYGITVNAICPGPIETPLMDKVRALGEHGDKMIASMIAATLVGRLGTPEEVAAAVAFLCSEQASYVTGEIIGVSGGMGVAAG